MTRNVRSTSENHAIAPFGAATVTALRENFGEIRILHLNENGLLIGEEQPKGAPCIHGGDGRTLKEIYERGSDSGGMVVRQRKDRQEA